MRNLVVGARTGRNLGLGVGLAFGLGVSDLARAAQPWLVLVEETDQRLQAPSHLAQTDPREKMYVWGDLNKNGWVDLVVIRKLPFLTDGKEPNLLLMNENGVLVDRTEQYASAVAQDQLPDGVVDNGFLTPTNDRFAVLADFTDNEWLDLATAVEISDGDAKHIGFPRVYINLGNDANGEWLGLRFENARIPHMCSKTGDCSANPRFTTVAAGDVTNNGLPDLYFGDHDAGVGFAHPQPDGHDFDNRLLINQLATPGYFADESLLRMGSLFNYGGSVGMQNYLYSGVGSGAAIGDFSGNGLNDVVKLTTLFQPSHVAVKYNDPAGVGTVGVFSDYSVVYSLTPYSIAAADLNNNGRLDLVVGDDGLDGIILNLATKPDGTVHWGQKIGLPGPSGFVSNVTVADLNNNGWNDIIIADMAVEVPGCLRATNIYGNDAIAPGVASFSNVSSIIPEAKRTGTFAVAAFDLTGSGWTDLVFGRCSGTNVWVSVPAEPVGPELAFWYVAKPVMIGAGDGGAAEVRVELSASGGELAAETVTLHAALDGGAFEATAMAAKGEDVFQRRCRVRRAARR